ncbi:MAG TPA: peptide deformylase [Candidatus Hydrogenedentes bacterium]|nr:peptide deformylase [Candidatus Hydrogenedentota bacterium]HOL76192.1 peptide deformylase [Candidatus Hydrogenedentota bacterium]HPO85995.1 peptide deformylase [Candidatus Hydrogenedentota bacterium]
MPLLNLVIYPDEPLQRVARPITVFGPELERLAQNMLETMHAHDGVGLAGPQVGISKRIIVLQEPDKEPKCLINPEILEEDGKEIGEEGCLSLPQIFGEVERARRIAVRAYDTMGRILEFESKGFEARIIQHETDHLNGIVFVDHLDILTRQTKLQELEQIRAQILAGNVGR